MNVGLDVLVFSFMFTAVAIKLFKPVAIKVGLVDKPNQRKLHSGSVPLVGGIAIFTGVAISAVLFQPLSHEQQVILSGAAVIVLLGMADDFYDLSVSLRLIVQTVLTLVVCLLLDIKLSYLGSMFGIPELDVGWFGYVVSVLGVIGCINAFNMIDGIDGLAGSMALITLTSLAFLFGLSGSESNMEWVLVFVTALFPYLTANFGIPPFKKIFMGDSGSMLIGFVIVWMLILGSQHTEAPSFHTVTALWLIAVPLMDMAAIMMRRIRKGKSPFIADQGHLHHIFMRSGLSSTQALIAISLIAALLAVIGISLEMVSAPEWFSFLLFMTFFTGYCYVLKHIWRFLIIFHKLFGYQRVSNI